MSLCVILILVTSAGYTLVPYASKSEVGNGWMMKVYDVVP